MFSFERSFGRTTLDLVHPVRVGLVEHMEGERVALQLVQPVKAGALGSPVPADTACVTRYPTGSE